MEVRAWRTANPVLVLLTAATGAAVLFPVWPVLAFVAAGPGRMPAELWVLLAALLAAVVLTFGDDVIRDRADARILPAAGVADDRTFGVLVDLKRHGVRARMAGMTQRELAAFVGKLALWPVARFWLVTVPYELPRAAFAAAAGFLLDIGTAIRRAVRS